MKIIHNLLFSIYFWANSLHTMHSTYTHDSHSRLTHTYQLTPIRAEIRSCSFYVYCGLPKGFHCCHPAYQQKAMRREQSCLFVHYRTNRHRKKAGGTKRRRKKTAAAAKWNFHSTFIYFSFRVVGCYCFFFLFSRRVLFSFFDSIRIVFVGELMGHDEMLMLIWLLFKYFTKDGMIYFEFFFFASSLLRIYEMFSSKKCWLWVCHALCVL